MAIQMIAIMGVFAFAGVKLDKVLDFKIPVFTIILSLAGVTLAIYSIVRGLFKKNNN